MNDEDAEALIECVLECCFGYVDEGNISVWVIPKERKGLIEHLKTFYEVKQGVFK